MALDYSIIGERIDVSVAFLSRVECGSVKANLSRIEQLCNILDVSISYVLTGTESTSKGYLIEDFSNLLKSCPPEKLKLIYDISKVIIGDK